MTTRDLNDNVDAAQSLVPAARTNGTLNGATVDLRGYDSAMIVVSFGAYTDGAHTPSVQYSDDGTNFTNAAAADLNGSFTAVSSGAGANTMQRAGFIGGRRYVRAVMTVSGATSGALSEALVLRGKAHRSPLA
ncbi:MAG: hypothetical protein WDO70_04175 [Alphaproteobacteria bacterium]